MLSRTSKHRRKRMAEQDYGAQDERGGGVNLTEFLMAGEA